MRFLSATLMLTDTYAYDDNGNISSITRGSSAVAYQYNGANELVRENNQFTQLHDYQ